MIFTCAPRGLRRAHPHSKRRARLASFTSGKLLSIPSYGRTQTFLIPRNGVSFAGSRVCWEQISGSASGFGRARGGPYVGIRPPVGGESLCTFEHRSRTLASMGQQWMLSFSNLCGYRAPCGGLVKRSRASSRALYLTRPVPRSRSSTHIERTSTIALLNEIRGNLARGEQARGHSQSDRST